MNKIYVPGYEFLLLLGVTGKKSKRKIWMQLRNKIELYKIRRVLKPIGCVSAQRREERLIISFNGNWLGYIEKGKLHIKDSEVSKIYLPEAAVVLDDSGEKYRKVDGKLNPDVFQSLVIDLCPEQKRFQKQIIRKC